MSFNNISLYIMIGVFFNSISKEHTLEHYELEIGKLTTSFCVSLESDVSWESYYEILEELYNDINKDIKNGSDFSSQEKNDLLGIRSKIELLMDFGTGIDDHSHQSVFNGKMLREIRVLIPEIKWEYVSGSYDSVVIYKVSTNKYVAYTARHNERNTMKKIKWWNKSMVCTYGGEFALTGGVYQTFWANRKCLNSTSPSIIITQCEVMMKNPTIGHFRWGRVNPFYD